MGLLLIAGISPASTHQLHTTSSSQTETSNVLQADAGTINELERPNQCNIRSSLKRYTWCLVVYVPTSPQGSELPEKLNTLHHLSVVVWQHTQAWMLSLGASEPVYREGQAAYRNNISPRDSVASSSTNERDTNRRRSHTNQFARRV